MRRSIGLSILFVAIVGACSGEEGAAPETTTAPTEASTSVPDTTTTSGAPPEAPPSTGLPAPTTQPPAPTRTVAPPQPKPQPKPIPGPPSPGDIPYAALFYGDLAGTNLEPGRCKALVATFDTRISKPPEDSNEERHLAMAHLYRGLARGCAKESRSAVQDDLNVANRSRKDFEGSSTCHPERMLVWGFERFLGKMVELRCTPTQ